MPLKIEYSDANTGLNFYALLLNNNTGQAWNPLTLSFGSYSDASIDNYDMPLTENVNRLKYYSYTIPSGTINANIYNIEIYRRTGSSPDKSVDIFKSSTPLYWNGSGVLENILTPRMNDGGFIGIPDVGATLTMHFETYDQFGNLKNADTTPSYSVYNGTTLVSPPTLFSLSNYDTGRYNLSFLLTSGYFLPGKLYQINLSSYMNGSLIGTSRSLMINDVTSVNASLSGIFDVADQLGYVSGTILSSLSSSGYYTNLIMNVNNQYNGGIMRVKTGNLKAQSRIVFDSAVSNGFIQTNKPFSASLTSGTIFYIIGIGGELNN